MARRSAAKSRSCSKRRACARVRAPLRRHHRPANLVHCVIVPAHGGHGGHVEILSASTLSTSSVTVAPGRSALGYAR